jgi:hypothetical protein
MKIKRRGIRLKQLDPDDASLQELLDSDLCLPDDPDDPMLADTSQFQERPPGEITREILKGLRETLAVLEGETAPLPSARPRAA